MTIINGTQTKITYEDDDRMLTRLMRELCPQLTISPEFARYAPPDNSPAAKAARVAASRR